MAKLKPVRNKVEILKAYPLDGLFDDLYAWASTQPVDSTCGFSHAQVLENILSMKAVACLPGNPRYNIFLKYFRKVKLEMIDGSGICGKYPRICNFVSNGRRNMRVINGR